MTLILFYAIPNTTAQLLVIFSPKITCLCILFTLLSRLSIAQASRRDGNNQSKSYDGRPSGSRGARRSTISAGSGFAGTTLSKSGERGSKGNGRWRVSFGQSSAGQTHSVDLGAHSQTNSFGRIKTIYERSLSLEQLGRRAADVETMLAAGRQAGSRTRLVSEQHEERVVNAAEAGPSAPMSSRR